MSGRFLESALSYHELGWSVIPIRHKTKKGKEPALPRWTPYQTLRPDPDRLRKWFSRDGLDGLAVVFGAVSGGLACRDFDRMEGYERWAAENPKLAGTLPTDKTRRGRHVYFRAGGEVYQKLEDGELLGNCKHYALLPQSVHPSGTVYEWLIPPESSRLLLLDPFEAGLAGVTERTEQREENRANRKAIEGGGNVLTIDEAIMSTLPQAAGKRNRCVFELARALKAIPGLTDADPMQLRGVVQRWHQLASPVITTQAFEETWCDFLYGWPRVRFPRGTEPMAAIVARAFSRELPPAAARYEQPQIRSLVAICRELQRASGGEPFFLSCRTVGRLLQVDQMKAWRWLFLLEADGILQTAQKGTRGQAGKASRFRYIAPD